MTNPTDRDAAGRAFWTRLSLVLLGLVACRGVVLMCVLPPFEGWDEYQHVAYVQHVRETGQPAVLGETKVPQALAGALDAFPQPRYPYHPLGKLGVGAYAAFWDRAPSPPPTGARPEEFLYQAQHGWTYYRLVGPLFEAAGGVGDLRHSVAALRVLNLLLTVAAVGGALAVVGRVVRDGRHAACAGLLIATQPLFLLNGVRVANDALGVALATAAVATGLGLGPRRLVARGAALGGLTGLAVLAKATNFGLVPFVAACWLLVAWRDRVPRARAALAAIVMAAAFLAVTQAELRFNLGRFGALSPMQDAVVNRRAGRTAWDLLRVAGSMGWGRRLGGFWFRDNLCIGGWSFLLASVKQVRSYRWAVLLCVAGWAFLAPALGRHGRARVFRSRRVPVACLALCLSYTAAMAYHMVQTRTAFGSWSGTGPWYACPAYPSFLLLVAAGGVAWPLGWFRTAPPLLLAAVFVYTEASMAWGTMVATYAGGAGGWEALRRLASLQPAALGVATLLAASAGAAALFAVAVGACVGALPLGAPAAGPAAKESATAAAGAPTRGGGRLEPASPVPFAGPAPRPRDRSPAPLAGAPASDPE